MSSVEGNQEALLPESMPTEGLPNEGLPNEGLPNEGLPNEGLPNEGTPITQREAAYYPLPASSSGSIPDEGSYTTPADLSISTTAEIINEGRTTKYYLGNRDFITLSIFALGRPETTFAGSGAFGKTYRIKVDGNYYYIKSVLFEKANFSDPLRFQHEVRTLEREIVTNIDITNNTTMRNYVSSIKGAYLSKSDTVVQAYLIFEAPNGIVLSDLIKIFPPEINNYKYTRLYCMIKRAQNALNTLGYVHSDIKPANIYVLIEGGDIRRGGKIIGCKLIDLGLTKKIGAEFLGAGSPRYMPHDMILENSKRVNMGISWFKSKYRGKITPRHNDYSVDVIWKEDFRMGDDPLPDCGSADMAGGRYRKKSRKTRKSKARKSKTRSRSS
jgi:hypothetical protein